MMNIIIASVLVMGFLGLVFALVLAYASKKFEVKKDERIEKILKLLPGANCGACGFASCEEFAKAVIEGKAQAHDCKIKKEAIAEDIKKIINQ